MAADLDWQPVGDDLDWQPVGQQSPAAQPPAAQSQQSMPQQSQQLTLEEQLHAAQRDQGPRFATGLADPIYGAAQIADRVLVDPIRQRFSPGASSMDDVIRSRDAALAQQHAPDEGFDGARMLGNVANPVSWAGGGATTLPRIALSGAAQSLLAPTPADQSNAEFAKAKAVQAGEGALLSAALTKALRGFTPTREAKTLMDQGIQPTVGQSLGGFADRLEQRAQSIPLVGDAVRWARGRAQKEFSETAIDRAASPKLPDVTDASRIANLDDANRYAANLYDSVVPHLKATPEARDGVYTALLESMRNPELDPASAKKLARIVEEHLGMGPLDTPADRFAHLSGDALKSADAQLGHLIRRYQRGSPADRAFADELLKIQGAFRDGLEHGLPQELQGRLRIANQVWRALIPLNRASSQRADELITPRALQRQQARQAGRDASRLPPDEFTDAGVKVFGSNQVPDSGTAERVLLAGGGLMGASAVGQLPAYLTAAGAAAIGALRGSQRALTGNTVLQRGLEPYADMLARASAAALRGRDDSR